MTSFYPLAARANAASPAARYTTHVESLGSDARRGHARSHHAPHIRRGRHRGPARRHRERRGGEARLPARKPGSGPPPRPVLGSARHGARLPPPRAAHPGRLRHARVLGAARRREPPARRRQGRRARLRARLSRPLRARPRGAPPRRLPAACPRRGGPHARRRRERRARRDRVGHRQLDPLGEARRHRARAARRREPHADRARRARGRGARLPALARRLRARARGAGVRRQRAGPRARLPPHRPRRVAARACGRSWAAAAAHYVRRGEDCPAANLGCLPWRDPFTGRVRSESLADLFDEARLSYPALAEAFVRGDRGGFRRLVGGLDYAGRPGTDD